MRVRTGRSLRVRTAVRRDVPGVVSLWKELMDFHTPIDPALARRRGGEKLVAAFSRKAITSPRLHVLLVAESGSCLVGYARARIVTMVAPPLRRCRRGVIMDMCVTRKERRQGVGKMMFRELKSWFRRRRVSRLEVSHMARNRISTAFWHRMGLRPLREVDVMRI